MLFVGVFCGSYLSAGVSVCACVLYCTLSWHMSISHFVRLCM